MPMTGDGRCARALICDNVAALDMTSPMNSRRSMHPSSKDHALGQRDQHLAAWELARVLINRRRSPLRSDTDLLCATAANVAMGQKQKNLVGQRSAFFGRPRRARGSPTRVLFMVFGVRAPHEVGLTLPFIVPPLLGQT